MLNADAIRGPPRPAHDGIKDEPYSPMSSISPWADQWPSIHGTLFSPAGPSLAYILPVGSLWNICTKYIIAFDTHCPSPPIRNPAEARSPRYDAVHGHLFSLRHRRRGTAALPPSRPPYHRLAIGLCSFWKECLLFFYISPHSPLFPVLGPGRRDPWLVQPRQMGTITVP